MNALLSQNLVDGAFVFVLGILVIFFGIAVIVACISIIGKIMSTKNKRKSAPEVAPQEASPVIDFPNDSVAIADEDEEKRIAAVISACIAAYYMQEDSACEFIIRKIRRI